MLELPIRRSGRTELRTIEARTPEYRRWIDLAADAYPITGFTTVGAREAAFTEQGQLADRQPEQRLVGGYRDGALVGGMRLYDFTMNVRGAQVLTGGIGSLAVSLEHKQNGIAHDLIDGYFAEYRERGAALGILYPFRPDFYGKLGFGYGAKLSQYRIALDALPAAGARQHVRRLRSDDVGAYLAAYHRVQARTNGLIVRERWRAELRLANNAFHTFGYDDGTGLSGYLTYEVRLGDPSTTNRNELYVVELVHEHPEALAALLAFARSQRDQFSTLIVNTTDPDFHFAVHDARNGSDRNLYPPVYHETNVQGLGVMYRVLSVPALVGALGAARFGDLDAVVRIDLADPALPANAGTFVIRFSGGRPELVDPATPADVALALGSAEFSALIMGSVRLRSLVTYGSAGLSQAAWLRPLDAAFDADPPQCLTRF
jgi:predicted acetyltransferase